MPRLITQILAAISTVLFLPVAQADEFKLVAECNVSRFDKGGKPDAFSEHKNVELESGSGEQGAQSIAKVDGIEIRMLSPMSAATSLIFIEGKAPDHTARAGRDVGQVQGNLVILSLQTPSGGTVAVTCVVKLRQR